MSNKKIRGTIQNKNKAYSDCGQLKYLFKVKTLEEFYRAIAFAFKRVNKEFHKSEQTPTDRWEMRNRYIASIQSFIDRKPEEYYMSETRLERLFEEDIETLSIDNRKAFAEALDDFYKQYNGAAWTHGDVGMGYLTKNYGKGFAVIVRSEGFYVRDKNKSE